MVVLGVDLRASPDRASAVAVLDDQAQVIHIGTFQADDDLWTIVRAYRPTLIAIGSPVSLPEGLERLQPPDPAAPTDSQRRGRQLELELARMGISCFFTNQRSIIRHLINRGVRLNRKLLKRGYPVVEVYPYATKLILFDGKVPPGNNARSLAFMRQQLPLLVHGLEPYMDSLDRNTCDALVSAYTALLHCRKETDVLGDPEEGLLVLPRLPR